MASMRPFTSGALTALTITAFSRSGTGRGVPPEYVAGAPIALDIIKCQLKPIDPADYKVPFSDAQKARLAAIFPPGVCDWSKQGVKQVKARTWASYGPSPVNQVFDVLDRRHHDDDDDD